MRKQRTILQLQEFSLNCPRKKGKYFITKDWTDGELGGNQRRCHLGGLKTITIPIHSSRVASSPIIPGKF